MYRIGLLTFHASHNYGSVLQAYALSKQLTLMGNQVKIINLRNNEQKKLYRIFKKHVGVSGVMRSLFTSIIYAKLKRRFDRYESFISGVLPITDKEYINGNQLAKEDFPFDAIVCGSDQIWNPNCPEFEPAYFLDFAKKTAAKIAYAPSLGKINFNEQTLKLISQLLQNIDFISVREMQAAKLLSTLTDKKVEVVCDPVVLLDKRYWDEIIVEPKIKKPYILTYFLSNNHGDRSLLKYFKQVTGFDVIVLNEYIRDYFKPYRNAYDAGPCEFIGLIKNAALVYTNSFHGIAFSTIFNKPFFASVAKEANAFNNNDSRKTDYLERLNLQNRIITDKLPEKKSILDIDYTEANHEIGKFRDNSLNYLQNVLRVNGGELCQK